MRLLMKATRLETFKFTLVVMGTFTERSMKHRKVTRRDHFETSSRYFEMIG